MANITVEAVGYSADDLLEVMVTGLDETDEIAWQEYCRAEYGAFNSAVAGFTKGVKVSGKGDKGKVTVKGADAKAKNVRINRALYALHLATATLDVAKSTGFEAMRVDISPLCAGWKKSRDERKERHTPEAPATP